MPFGIDNDRYIAFFAEGDQSCEQVISQCAFSVVGENAGVQIVDLCLDAIINIALGLRWNKVALFPVGAQHLLTMGKNTSFGRGWSILTGVKMHRDTG